jgi:hypothetical protein
MIVRYESDGSLVMITQNDHAKLSGLFAAHWGNRQFEKPRPQASTTRAAQYHDIGWLRYEAKPHFNVETGKTPNFREIPNDQTQLDSYQWALDWSSAIDSYAGLLISKHRTGLWQSRYSVINKPQFAQRGSLSEAIKAFIARNEAKQKAAAAAFDADELAVNYHLLQVWDLLSLYICTQERHKEEFIQPVPTSYGNGEGVGMRLQPISSKRISVDPYPFDQAALQLGVVYRRLPATFPDARTFELAYFEASPQLASFTFDPADSPH